MCLRGSLSATVLLLVVGIGSQAVITAEDRPGRERDREGTKVTSSQQITPLAAPGSRLLELQTHLRKDDNADGGFAVSTALSPDGAKLLVLTSGSNTGYSREDGTPILYSVLDPITAKPTSQTTSNAEWVFVYDVRERDPKLVQKIDIPNTYIGLAWDPSGKRFYVSGGIGDLVYSFRLSSGKFVADAPFFVLNTGVLLDSTPAGPAIDSFGLTAVPMVAGVAVNQEGSKLYAANFENDSVSILDIKSRQLLKRIQFAKPGGDEAIGEYPYWIVCRGKTKSKAEKVFVSSQRDSQVMVIEADDSFHKIDVGAEPNKMILSSGGDRLFVANGDSDSISIIDTGDEKVTGTISLLRPGHRYKGADPNSLALSPDERILYVTLGGENAVAVIDLERKKVVGRIPVTWNPNSVSVSKDGRTLYVVNEKNMPGPNPAYNGMAPNPTNLGTYIMQIEKANLLVIPTPDRRNLRELSEIVDHNNGFAKRPQEHWEDGEDSDGGVEKMERLRHKIKHVIYIVKENRSYDQVLGDLPVGNGDPTLTMFPQPVTPNHHKLALDFVTLDNFYTSGDVSGDGWNWSTQARVNDYEEKSVPPDYGNGFSSSDVYATDRNIVVGLNQEAEPANQFTERLTALLDPSGRSNILPGPKDIGGTEGDGDLSSDAIGGYLWDEALRRGKTLRHYGFYTDYTYYFVPPPLYIPISRTPFASKLPQGPPLKPSLRDVNDIYYRGFDLSVPDRYHYEEWKREFDNYVKNDNLPELEIMSLPLDHFGSFSSNVGGLNTPTLQIADNDYALGKMVDAVSHSKYWKDTVFFVIEDDAQDGPDHVDAHRSPAFVISAYTKRNQVVHQFYTTVNVMKTMEDLLGLRPLGIFDENADPMSAVFTTEPDLTPYTPVLPGVLCEAPVDPKLIPECHDRSVMRTAAAEALHDGMWWAKSSEGFNFRKPDALDTASFNRVLWKGVMGDKPYPNTRSGRDLSKDRQESLKNLSLSTRH